MHWRDQLTLINRSLQESNLVRLNIITDTRGYLVKNDIIHKNLNMFLPFVPEKLINNIDNNIMMDNGEFNPNVSNKHKILKIINQLEFNLPVKI